MDERQFIEPRRVHVVLPATGRPSSGYEEERPDRTAPYDRESFSAGQQTGARVAAITSRLAALELMNQSRWWNRWRIRLMARALIAHAEEMEQAADESSAAGRMARA